MSKSVSLALVFIGLMAYPIHTKAQGYFNGFGSIPHSRDWSILKSPDIHIIYGPGMEPQAQRVANMVRHINDSCTRSVGAKRLKVDLVLQTQTTIPNGYVTLGPARSEFFCTPPAGNTIAGSLDWLDFLTIHEYRHILQYANSRHGLTKTASIFGGQNLWSAMIGISIPSWYFEGDAVIAETALTTGGRGRSAFFTRELRAMAYDNRFYRYSKLRNGSFKTQLPNHYTLGYVMLNHARNEKGNDFTAAVLKQASAYKGLFYPFSRAMKRHTGYTTSSLYMTSIEKFNADARQTLQDITLSQFERITTTAGKCVTEYLSPRFLSDGSVLVNKSSNKKNNALYLLSNGKEKRLTSIGYSVDDYISVGNDIAAWTELSSDARRTNLNYTNVVLYDIKSNTKTQLTRKARYFSPVVSDDGNLVAAIHMGSDQLVAIHLLDSKSGKLVKSIPVAEKTSLSRLAWLSPNELVSIARHNSRLSVVKFDMATQAMTALTPATSHVLDGMSVSGDEVYFQSDFSGIDNIYKVKADGSKQIYQVTSVPVGAYLPDVSADGKQVVYSEINSMGFHLCKATSQSGTTPIEITEPVDMEQYNTMANGLEGGDILSKVPANEFESQRYNGLFKGLKLHSWTISPSYSQPEINLQMQNIFNDVKLSFGGGINRNEGMSDFYSADIKIGRYYPEIGIRSRFGKRSTDFFTDTDSLINMEFEELSYGATVGLPLAWMKGIYITRFNPFVGYTQRSLYEPEVSDVIMEDNSFGAYDIGLAFSTKRRAAKQHVGSRLGVAVDFNYTQSVDFENEKINGATSFYLPGVGANHNVVLKAGYQRESLDNYYQFVDAFEYPRGFGRIINDEVTSYSINYALPLLYPDFGIAGITYFKRIRANVFYDAAVTQIRNRSTNFSSAGFELIFDNINLNYTPLSIGLRTAYLVEGGPSEGETNFGFYLSTEF